ncbi:iron-sulfur cluster assembly protein 1-like protein [Carex littledalei]|uniref:Iron-sulfur cluster assembly protein n=1 Tax=Carex littledalei TaxID=544730 RepID=A0A833RQF4_9POAL|nr:iron-sulfur cluster assembly protein 1-like protein [Carex littledalei]
MLRLALKRSLGLCPAASPASSAAVVNRGYHERVVDHYNNPRNIGSFDKEDSDVGTGLVGAPACGDVMKLQIKVDEDSGKIVDACFKTFGCGSAIASSSVATEWVKGKQMEEVVTIKNTEIAKHLSLPPVKLHCSMLAEDAIKAAVKDYESKKKANGAHNGNVDVSSQEGMTRT